MVDDWLEPHRRVLDGVVALFGPWVEAVAHDVARDEIVEIWNPISGRKVGERSLLGADRSGALGDDVVGPYVKVGTSGEPVTSVSIPVGDGAGLICINFDRTQLLGVAEMLSAFARPLVGQPTALFEFDWREQISIVVDDWCRQQQVRRNALTVAERRELIRALRHKGLFDTRHAAQHAARALGVSRATIYADLKEIQ